MQDTTAAQISALLAGLGLQDEYLSALTRWRERVRGGMPSASSPIGSPFSDTIVEAACDNFSLGYLYGATGLQAKMRSLTYLACPYSHSDPGVRARRYDAVTEVAAALIKQRGLFVFSPISHSHPIVLGHAAEVGSWEYWKTFDLAIIAICKKLIVLKLEGWEKSVGVTAEVAEALRLEIPVEYLDPVGIVPATLLGAVDAITEATQDAIIH